MERGRKFACGKRQSKKVLTVILGKIALSKECEICEES